MSQTAPPSPPSAIRAAESSLPVPTPLPRRRSRWILLLSVLGPGIVSAAAGNDAGGIATFSKVGANYGLQLMWGLALVTVGLVVVQEMCARMGAVTGKGLGDLIREVFGVKVAVFALSVLLLANFAITVSEFAGVAAVGEMFHVPRWVSVPLSMIVVALLVARGSYQKVERVFLVASLVFVTYIITALKIGVPWAAVLHATFVPHVAHPNADLIVMLVTLIGTTISPYMQFYQQAATRDKGITVKDYALAKWDTILGCVLSSIVAGFIIVACTGTLYAHHLPLGDSSTAADVAQALRPLAGEYARLLFAFGLLNASLLAATVVPLSTAYAVAEALGWEGGLGRRVRESPLFYGTFGFLILFGGLVLVLPGTHNLLAVILGAQAVNCALLPVELVLMLLLINRRRVMGRFRNNWAQNVVAYITVGVATFLSLWYLVLLFVPHR